MATKGFGLLGRKVGMTQVFDTTGNIVGVTVVQVTPNTVLQVKREGTKDGYSALQLGAGAKKLSRSTKAELGHAKKAGLEVAPRAIHEFRIADADAAKYTVGQAVVAGDLFAAAERIDVIGTTKGRGFAGVFKRHNFSGMKASHGTHEYFRHGGSIGTRLTPGMTLKGMPMAGQYGTDQVTVQNIQVFKIDGEKNVVLLKGGIPGAPGSLVILRKAAKK